jgi:branched-chain amino acid transport system ATP-binding protein
MSKQQPIPESVALALRGLEKNFGGLSIMRGVTFDVTRGERHAVIGPNGAGKSTLFNLISGAFPPTGGVIALNGEPIQGLAPEAINRKGLARSFQISNIFGRMSAFENIRIGVMARHGARFDLFRPISKRRRVNDEAMALLERIRLGHRADTLAGDLSYSEHRSRRDLAGRTHGGHVQGGNRPCGRPRPGGHSGQDPPDRGT